MKTLLPYSVAVLLAASATAQMILIDFGRTDLQSGPHWNNVIPATTILNSLVDSGGNAVPNGAGLEITNAFFQTGEPSQLGSEAPVGDAAGFLVSATDDYFFGHTTPFAGADANPLSQFKLFNLDPTATYDFTFFSSRQTVSDNRETRFTVTGSSSSFLDLNPSNNNSAVAKFLGIAPDGSNEIFVDVAPGPNNDNSNGFYYLGLLQIDIIPDRSVVPEPSAVGLLGFLVAGGLLLGRRRRI